MRIFYASDNSPNPSFQSDLWRRNLYCSLLDLGHEVVEFEFDLREVFMNLDPSVPAQAKFIRENRDTTTRELMRQIEHAHATEPIDLFFSYLYDACVHPSAIDAIRSLGIKTMNWYCNASYQLHLVKEISPHYDWCLVPEKFRIQDYRDLGANPIYCQEAANPNVYMAYDLPHDFDVTFVGQCYGERPLMVNYLLKNGLDLHVWGAGWNDYTRSGTVRLVLRNPIRAIGSIGKRALRSFGSAGQPFMFPAGKVGGILSDEELIKMFSRSKINLGFSSVGYTFDTGKRITQLRLRDFEIPMAGGFYLVEFMEELEAFFEIDKEIVCYSTKEELEKKIRYYLMHDDEREKIRIAGHERARRDHTWQKRLDGVFRHVGLMR